MKKFASQSTLILAAWLGSTCCAGAATVGPTAAPTSLSFSYTIGAATLPASATVKITVPASLAGKPLQVTTPNNWIVVSPSGGYAPLTLTVSFNPTGLAPGSQQPQIIQVDTNPASGSPATVTVYATIVNPPPTLGLISPQSGPGGAFTAGSGSIPNIVTFTYTTGGSTAFPASSLPTTVPAGCGMELDVYTNGGIIPFNVTTATVKGTGSSGSSSSVLWVRVNSNGQSPANATSGVANTGSYLPICVTADVTTVGTLNPGSYSNQITIAGANSANGTIVVLVNLTVAAGLPTVTSIYPYQIVARPGMNPVFTIYGTNFFNTSVVMLSSAISPAPITGVTTTLLSQNVLQATVPKENFTDQSEGTGYPITWLVWVNNPSTSTNPTPQNSGQWPLLVVDPNAPIINQIVNAASLLPTSYFSGTNNPIASGGTSVSPGEIISIFGVNLGPSSVWTNTPVAGAYQPGITYVGTTQTVQAWVYFKFMALVPPDTVAYEHTEPAPIIMFSSNQINVVAPYDLQYAVPVAPSAYPAVAIQATISITDVNGNPTGGGTTVLNNPPPLNDPTYPTILPEDPGLFTFGGAGQGQGAVQNQDYSINGSKNPASRGSTILIYATGLGTLTVPPTGDGVVATAADSVSDQTVVVEIGGQPANVTYAGTSTGSIDGLVQINAIVPPTVTPGSAVPITVAIGQAGASHRTQTGATICVK